MGDYRVRFTEERPDTLRIHAVRNRREASAEEANRDTFHRSKQEEQTSVFAPHVCLQESCVVPQCLFDSYTEIPYT